MEKQEMTTSTAKGELSIFSMQINALLCKHFPNDNITDLMTEVSKLALDRHKLIDEIYK